MLRRDLEEYERLREGDRESGVTDRVRALPRGGDGDLDGIIAAF